MREVQYDENRGPLEGGPLGLAPDVYDIYSRMGFYSDAAVEYLNESWQRPKRHNKRLERCALWYSILLDEDCRTALEPARNSLLLPPSTDPRTRYELQAGIRVVHATLPFTIAERHTLSRDADEGLQSEGSNAIGESELVNRWHEWLWMDECREPQTSIESLGASAILEEGCKSLHTTIHKILGWDQPT